MVASCLDVAHAELTRSVLASAGIPVTLGSATLLSWFWHYSNAVGGVTIHVRRRDVAGALEALAAARAEPSDDLPAWNCPACDERIGGMWDACWHCSRWRDGAPSPADAAIAAPEIPAVRRIWSNSAAAFALVGFILVLILLGRFSPGLALMLATLVFVVLFLLRQSNMLVPKRLDAAGPPRTEAEPDEDLPGGRSVTLSAVSRAKVRRAWQAAVIGGCALPPLAFYSIWLLWKLRHRHTPLGWADRWRAGAALLLNLGSILYCCVVAGAVLLAALHALR
jgi:hypothetical protein